MSPAMMYSLATSTICSYSAAVSGGALGQLQQARLAPAGGFAVCGHRCLQLRDEIIQPLLAPGEGRRRRLIRIRPKRCHEIKRVKGTVEDDHRARTQQHSVGDVDITGVGVGRALEVLHHFVAEIAEHARQTWAARAPGYRRGLRQRRHAGCPWCCARSARRSR